MGQDKPRRRAGDERAKYYRFQWLDAILASDLPAGARLLAAVLFSHCRGGAKCFPTLRTLAGETNLDLRTVRKYRARLIEDEWLEMFFSPGRGHRTNYLLGHPDEIDDGKGNIARLLLERMARANGERKRGHARSEKGTRQVGKGDTPGRKRGLARSEAEHDQRIAEDSSEESSEGERGGLDARALAAQHTDPAAAVRHLRELYPDWSEALISGWLIDHGIPPPDGHDRWHVLAVLGAEVAG